MTFSSRIGIVAPSSRVPKVELELGVQKIRELGFQVDVAPQCQKGHLFFAGTDEERATAFFKFAKSPEHFSIWCARGGHGAIRLLPLLEKMAFEQGTPDKKLLIGYSDVTALMEYVRRSWGWSVLHAPMPSMRKFTLLPESDWDALVPWVQRVKAPVPWAHQKLSFWTSPPKSSVVAPLVGGNLTVWNCLLGTRFQGKADRCMLFLEDVDEGLYRIDRMMQQLWISKSLDRVKAIILGNFMNCRDYSPQVLKKMPTPRVRKRVLNSPKAGELQPLRKTFREGQALRQIFSEMGNKLGIPVVYGLPAGHGPEVSPLPLGARFRLTPEGRLELLDWDWFRDQS